MVDRRHIVNESRLNECKIRIEMVEGGGKSHAHTERDNWGKEDGKERQKGKGQKQK